MDLSGCNAIIILPGLGNCAADYDELKAGLMDRGARRVEVLPIARLDWFRNVAGFADPAYWRGELEPRPILNWYVDRVEKLVDEMGEDVTIIGHSAGGSVSFLTPSFPNLMSLVPSALPYALYALIPLA